MYDIRHRLIWAVSGFVAALSLLVLVTLAGYGFFKALLLSALILALVALILWILWVSEPESLVEMLAAPPAGLPRPEPQPVLPAGGALAGDWLAGRVPEMLEPEMLEPGAAASRDFPVAPGAQGPAETDDLKRISGIGPRIEALLNAEGIFRFAQIAGWDAAEIDRIDALLRFHGRIRRDDWQGQARALNAGTHKT